MKKKGGNEMVLSIVFYKDKGPVVFLNNNSNEIELKPELAEAAKQIQSLKTEIEKGMNAFGFKKPFGGLSEVEIFIWTNKNGVKIAVIDIVDTNDQAFALPIHLQKALGIKEHLDLFKAFAKGL